MSTPPDPRLVLAVLERAAEPDGDLAVSQVAHAAAIDVATNAVPVLALLDEVGRLSSTHFWLHRRQDIDTEASWRLAARDAAALLRRHILSVCLFVGAIAGALPIEARRLIAAYCAGDADALFGLADLVEERGLTGPLALWAEERQDWLKVPEHEHVWLQWVSGDEKRALRYVLGPPDFDLIRRCTCGMFEHETRRRPRKTLTAAARRRRDALRDRAVREFRGHRADRIFVDDPPTVHDE